MMQDNEYPSTAMYSTLKQFAGISNKDLAKQLFASTYSYGGSSIHERFEERTFLTRNIVRAEPGSFPESAFLDFPSSARLLCSKILSKQPGIKWRQDVCDYFFDTASMRMCQALKDNGLNDLLYVNMRDQIQKMRLDSLADKAELFVLLFISTGCLGDPARAVEITQQHAQQLVHSELRTVISSNSSFLEADNENTDGFKKIGLCRVISDKLAMPIHLISTQPEGTEIGTLATASGAINNVDMAVSRRHARVFRDETGTWNIQGLGSTNGTTVIRGGTNERIVVEPPRGERKSEEHYAPVPIYPWDTICLAGVTKFVVLEIAD